MKKLLSVILVVAAVLSFASCGNSENSESSDIRKVIYNELAEYYKGRTLCSYKEIAALCASGFDMSGVFYSSLLKSDVPAEEYLISVYFLKKSGVTGDWEFFDSNKSTLESLIAEPDKIDTERLSTIIIALELNEIEYNKTLLTDSLVKRQDTVQMGFYEYPQTGGSSKLLVSCAAYALTAYMAQRSDVRTNEYEDTLHDGALTYLGNLIGDDNMIADDDYLSDVTLTSRVLASLISAEIPLNGEISTALLNAIHLFASVSGGKLYGYKNNRNGENDSEATAEVLFAVVCTLYGNIFTESGK